MATNHTPPRSWCYFCGKRTRQLYFFRDAAAAVPRRALICEPCTEIYADTYPNTPTCVRNPFCRRGVGHRGPCLYIDPRPEAWQGPR